MKRLFQNTKWLATLAVACGLVQNLVAADNNPTAFSLIKEGHRYISEEAHDKVVAIHSDKSADVTAPNTWYITYYDKDASLKAVTVKFVNGQKADVDRPFRLLERASGKDAPLERAKMKTDSNAALSTASDQPQLKGLTLRAVQMWLDNYDGEPQWKVQFWAAKVKHPEDSTDVGEVFVSCETGKVTKTDLHPGHVD